MLYRNRELNLGLPESQAGCPSASSTIIKRNEKKKDIILANFQSERAVDGDSAQGYCKPLDR